MTPLEALAVDYVRARIEENQVRKDYMSRYALLEDTTQDYEDAEINRLGAEKMSARNKCVHLESAMISHVKAAYEDELKSLPR